MVYVRTAISMSKWDEIYSEYPDYQKYLHDFTFSPLSSRNKSRPENEKRFSSYFFFLQVSRHDLSLAGLKYLDTGSNEGDALVVAKECFGLQAHGIEGRDDVAKLISKQRDLSIVGMSSDTLDVNLFGGNFDVVIACETLEHSF